MRVLLVEDSARLQKSVGTALRRSGYSLDLASDGEEGLWMAESNDYDAIVLDIMLPKRDGLSVLKLLRQSGRSTHVLLLTARDTVPDRVKGFEAGADDYLIKPFALEELLVRVQALCRRAYGKKSDVIEVGPLSIDVRARRAACAGRPVDLTAREFALLEYLARRKGDIVSRSEIEAHIYDNNADPMSNVVDSAICTLRKKIGAVNPAPLIHTRRGLGYVLDHTLAEAVS